MSMLSAQIDELRAMAQLEKNLERPAIARILDDAADTILELRDDLQRANSNLQDAEHDESVAWDRVRKAEAENAKLRDVLVNAPKCEACVAMLDCDECLRADGSHKERRRLSAENAKLRELCADMWFWSYEGHIDSESQERQMLHIDAVIQRMHELGVKEVDG